MYHSTGAKTRQEDREKRTSILRRTWLLPARARRGMKYAFLVFWLKTKRVYCNRFEFIEQRFLMSIQLIHSLNDIRPWNAVPAVWTRRWMALDHTFSCNQLKLTQDLA